LPVVAVPNIPAVISLATFLKLSAFAPLSILIIVSSISNSIGSGCSS
jgi:hypothetical protein